MSGLQTEYVFNVSAALGGRWSVLNGGIIERDDRALSRVECCEDGESLRCYRIDSPQDNRRQNAGVTSRIRRTLFFRDTIRFDRPVMRIVTVILAVVMLLATFPSAGAATTTTLEHISSESPMQLRNADVTSEEALSAKERAKQAYNRLNELESRNAINVDSDLLHSIKYHLDKGNLAFQTHEYKKAIKQYEIAIDQARTGVKKAYLEGSRTILNGSETYLNARKELGYVTPEMGMLISRIDKQQNGLEGVTSLTAARDKYQAAQELQSDIQNLPAPWLIQTVSFATSIWLLVLIVVILAGGSVWGYRRLGSEDRSADTDLH
jgi:tetratricopeptide (TPR) repeat protein